MRTDKGTTNDCTCHVSLRTHPRTASTMVHGLPGARNGHDGRDGGARPHRPDVSLRRGHTFEEQAGINMVAIFPGSHCVYLWCPRCAAFRRRARVHLGGPGAAGQSSGHSDHHHAGPQRSRQRHHRGVVAVLEPLSEIALRRALRPLARLRVSHRFCVQFGPARGDR